MTPNGAERVRAARFAAPQADADADTATAEGRASAPTVPRRYRCICGRPVFFRNSQCLACGSALGFDSTRLVLVSIVEVDAQGDTQPLWWRRAGAATDSLRFSRCANLSAACACNWLVDEHDAHAGRGGLCPCCRLTRTLPDLALPDNGRRWLLIEQAKRQLVSGLLALRLPLASKTHDDAEHGLAFDLLQSAPGAAPVRTGHEDGVITLDVEEADDVTREQRRSALREPYRTLLGHLRHESGHYYWQRLVADGSWLQVFRRCFGDERADYAAAMQRHYEQGAPPQWADVHVSAYASSHPWEDWAETWAHYLHMVDTLGTAHSFGFDGTHVELGFERYHAAGLGAPVDARSEGFVAMLNRWMELNGVLNELSRAMGLHDFYPFVLSEAVVRKLWLVHRIVADAAVSGAQILPQPLPQPSRVPHRVAAATLPASSGGPSMTPQAVNDAKLRTATAHVPPPTPDVVPPPPDRWPPAPPDLVPPPDVQEPPTPGNGRPVDEPGRPPRPPLV
jgi:hypothetical protein